MIHRTHIVDDLADIFRQISAFGINFELQNIFQRALRSFDLRAKNRLLPNIHRNVRSGLGSTEPTPSNRPRERSASDSSRVSSASITKGGLGGNGAGIKALYPLLCFTYCPDRKIANPSQPR